MTTHATGASTLAGRYSVAAHFSPSSSQLSSEFPPTRHILPEPERNAVLQPMLS